ncbi:MAG: glycosyltransferase family 2 protein [Desulfuromonadales bacterium]|nr:glycosyltransferase family 2 protein [Desulfuromonadales bacterium]
MKKPFLQPVGRAGYFMSKVSLNTSIERMKQGDPLVSIALPVYNGGATLAAAIRSILCQTYTNWELIIIDDGSSDNSVAVARNFHDPRIRLLINAENKSLPVSLNIALDNSTGEYFARMDQDDVSFPMRIEKQVNYMQAHSSIDLLGAGILYYSGDGVPHGKLPVRESHKDICSKPWSGFYLAHPTWFGRKEWFMKHRYRASATNAEDQDLLFRTYVSSHFACLPEVLLGYREEPRFLKKIFKARFSFLKSAFIESIKSKEYVLAMKIVYTQYIKSFCDVLNVYIGVKSLRNTVLPIELVLLKEWTNIWDMVSTSDPNDKYHIYNKAISNSNN